MDLSGKKVHMLGICGTGMSALAGLLKSKGALVSGSDTQFYPPVGPMLRKMGVTVFEGYDARHIRPGIDLFVVGNVVGRGNPEVERLLNAGCAYESMAEALYRYVLAGRRTVVLAGTHGKTTTSAFLSHLFSCCDRDPGYFIAGNPVDLPQHFRLGGGEHFFVEGDEYETAFFDRSSKFLKYRPHDLILTALEHDHVDFFPEAAAYQKSFSNLVNTVPGDGLILYNQDYPMAREVIRGAFSRTFAFGLNPGLPSGVLIRVDGIDDAGISFALPWHGGDLHFTTPLIGRYNLLNLCAGILYGLHSGLEYGEIEAAVRSFHGVERRMTRLGQIGNTLFLEDFAHHPTAIASAIRAVKETYPHKKALTVIEPRSWSLRRNRFAAALRDSLQSSDEVWICEIYQKEKLAAAERLDVNGLSGELASADRPARAAQDAEQIWTWLQELDTRQERVVLLLSNGAFGGLPGRVRALCGA